MLTADPHIDRIVTAEVPCKMQVKDGLVTFLEFYPNQRAHLADQEAQLVLNFVSLESADPRRLI